KADHPQRLENAFLYAFALYLQGRFKEAELQGRQTEVPSIGVEIERRRCNLSFIAKSGTSPTKGEHRHAAADHDEPAAVKSVLRISGASRSPASPEMAATHPGGRSHRPPRTAEVATPNPSRCRARLPQRLRQAASPDTQHRDPDRAAAAGAWPERT